MGSDATLMEREKKVARMRLKYRYLRGHYDEDEVPSPDEVEDEATYNAMLRKALDQDEVNLLDNDIREEHQAIEGFHEDKEFEHDLAR